MKTRNELSKILFPIVVNNRGRPSLEIFNELVNKGYKIEKKDVPFVIWYIKEINNSKLNLKDLKEDF